MVGRSKHCGGLVALFGAASVLTPAIAWAWGSSALFSATVWGHKFSDVTVKATGCIVETAIKYNAPDKAYKSRLQGMNEYRFKARARFASGKSVESAVFTSTKAGSASHTYRVDTQPEGCWAKQDQKLVAVDVEGCRGKGCRVESFK